MCMSFVKQSEYVRSLLNRWAWVKEQLMSFYLFNLINVFPLLITSVRQGKLSEGRSRKEKSLRKAGSIELVSYTTTEFSGGYLKFCTSCSTNAGIGYNSILLSIIMRQTNQILCQNSGDKNWLTVEGFGWVEGTMDHSPSTAQYTQHIPRGFTLNSQLFRCARESYWNTGELLVVVAHECFNLMFQHNKGKR